MPRLYGNYRGAVRGRVTIVKQVEIIEARSSPCSLFLGGQDVWQCASGYFAERRRSTSDINGLCDLVSGGAGAADLALPITPRHSARRQPGERTAQRPLRGILALEHDPEKWGPVFPRDKREAFARRSCSNRKIERDDDSKKSHHALEAHTVSLTRLSRRRNARRPYRMHRCRGSWVVRRPLAVRSSANSQPLALRTTI